MRDKIIDVLKRIALFFGFSFSRTTNPGKLAFFFSKIRPVITNHKLVRIGGNDDGGYLVPDDLDGIKHCFSPGVSFAAHFENELASKGIKSFMADYSVEKPPINNDFFSFEKVFVGFENQPNFKSLENWIGEKVTDADHDMILQMDIEGGEYDVLMETSSETLKRFRIILVEFHDVDRLFDPIGYQLISAAFYKLLKDFEVVHIHPNNFSKTLKRGAYEIPPLLEFTFLRKDRISQTSFAGTFPHPLDRVNVKEKPDFNLPECFYKG
ncbi:MAG: FkbM family methyltransferase [Ferruginibacter sp.]